MPSSLFIINNIPSAQHLHVAVQLSKGSRQPLSCLLNHCIHSVLLVVRRGAGVSAQLVRLRGIGATSTIRESDSGSPRLLGYMGTYQHFFRGRHVLVLRHVGAQLLLHELWRRRLQGHINQMQAER